MSDKFAKWDKFARHLAYTNDPHKALDWTKYEIWAEKRRIENLQRDADMLALASAVKADGVASKKTT